MLALAGVQGRQIEPDFPPNLARVARLGGKSHRAPQGPERQGTRISSYISVELGYTLLFLLVCVWIHLLV